MLLCTVTCIYHVNLLGKQIGIQNWLQLKHEPWSPGWKICARPIQAPQPPTWGDCLTLMSPDQVSICDKLGLRTVLFLLFGLQRTHDWEHFSVKRLSWGWPCQPSGADKCFGKACDPRFSKERCCSSSIPWKYSGAAACFGQSECMYVYLGRTRAVWPIPVFLEALCEWRGSACVTVCRGGRGAQTKEVPFVTLMFREMQKKSHKTAHSSWHWIKLAFELTILAYLSGLRCMRVGAGKTRTGEQTYCIRNVQAAWGWFKFTVSLWTHLSRLRDTTTCFVKSFHVSTLLWSLTIRQFKMIHE